MSVVKQIDTGAKVDFLDYPKDMKANRRYRAFILQRAEDDPLLQAAIKEKCRRSLIYWIDLFCWTKDPRRQPDIIPFISYDFQIPALLDIQQAITEKKDLLIEKSRDMGVSWLVLYVYMHMWLFEKGSDFRVGSRKKDFVDKIGDIDTLFEKIRFNIEKMPLWLMPQGFQWRTHSSDMRLVSPETGNAIIGESANPSFASGGRRKSILMDEFAKWDHSVAEAAWTSTADASPSRIVVSTPVGSGNKFAQLANGTKEKIEKISLHWTLHPTKRLHAYYLDGEKKIPIGSPPDVFKIWKEKRGILPDADVIGGLVRSPWYDFEAERRSAADVAQELDIDYLRSGFPFFHMGKLTRQKVWEEMRRDFPEDGIPYGKMVKVNLVMRKSEKVEVRDMPRMGWLKIYEEPKTGYQYVIGVDTGEGLAKGDESVLVCREKITRNVCAVCNGIYAPEEIAHKSFLVEKYYNDALNMAENNNHGYTTNRELELLGSNLYYTKRDVAGGEMDTFKKGWTTSVTSRPLILDEMEEEIRKASVELRDENLIKQCQTFVRDPKKGKPQADGQYLDDLVLACAISGRGITENPFKGSGSKNKDLQRQRVYELRKKKKNGGFSYGKV